MGKNGEAYHAGWLLIMQLLTLCFWLGTVAVCYTFLLYPMAIALMARLWPRLKSGDGSFPAGVSIVLAAHNEQERIGRRLRELIDNLSRSEFASEIILISDGSTDDTAVIARSYGDQVIVIDLQTNLGKSAALNYGVSLAQYEVIAFADARQRWSPTAVDQLLECFRDPAVGAVSGELVLESEPGVLAGVGLYWKFEKWLRSRESVYESQIGVTGAICAVRRELYTSIPAGIILDDVYWPMQVALKGYRVIYQAEAKAFDRLPQHTGTELQRKLRTLVGNFQLMAASPQLLVPWRNPLWLQFVSHKAMRLVTPWALLMTFCCSFFLSHPFYQVAFVCQLFGLIAGVIGLSSRFDAKGRIFSATGAFLLLQIAAWLAFWFWILGRTQNLWGKTSLQLSPVDQSQKP